MDKKEKTIRYFKELLEYYNKLKEQTGNNRFNLFIGEVGIEAIKYALEVIMDENKLDDLDDEEKIIKKYSQIANLMDGVIMNPPPYCRPYKYTKKQKVYDTMYAIQRIIGKERFANEDYNKVKEEARDFLMHISYEIGTIGMEYLTDKDAYKMREAIDILYSDDIEE